MIKNHGFTLIEIMIVVALIGVLAAIAYPSYEESVLKGRRAQARTALLELQQQQERYMTQFNCYLPFTTSATFVATTSVGCDGKASSKPDTVPFKVFAGESTTQASYRLSAGTCTASDGTAMGIKDCIQLTASPVKSDPKVGALTISSNGVKSCTGTSKSTQFALCWP